MYSKVHTDREVLCQRATAVWHLSAAVKTVLPRCARRGNRLFFSAVTNLTDTEADKPHPGSIL